MTESSRPAPPERVRIALAAADRRRRRRAAVARLWRVAPFAAAGSLGVAAVSRWAGWPASLPLAVLGGGFVVLAVDLVFSARSRGVSDPVAAVIDADAGLGGELRSASWFASRQTRDPWADFHISRAADRLDGVNWRSLYPRVRAARSVAATSVMVVATIAMAILFPQRAGIQPNAAAHTAASVKDTDREMLPPELLEQLEALLAAAEAGGLAPSGSDGKSATATEIRDLLERLRRDPDALKDLARALNAGAIPENGRTVQDMKTLAERARRAAEKDAVSPELREAMKDLARNLSDAAAEESANDGSLNAASEALKPGEAGRSAADMAIDEAQIRAVTEAQGAAGGAGVMMSQQDAAAGSAAAGLGVGGSGSATGDSRMTDIERALRQETIEASRDTGGTNVDAQVRRTTEQGQAAVTFTGTASGTSERGRAAARPAVPEARRTEIQRYFIRKPS